MYEIDESEAAIVRRIFHEYLSGNAITKIAKDLEREGIRTKLGKAKWQPRTILNILENEIYIGNALLGKTYKPDVLSRKRVKNVGQAPMFYVEGSHPAIIDTETFNAVKQEIAYRKDGGIMGAGNTRYTSKYAFSGLLVCGHCGTKLRRQVRTVGSGKKVPAWGCAKRITEGRAVCNSHHINEAVIEATYSVAMSKLIGGVDEIVDAIKGGLDKKNHDDTKTRIEEIEDTVRELQDKTIEAREKKANGIIDDNTYREKITRYAESMQALEMERREAEKACGAYISVCNWVDGFTEAIENGEIANAGNGTVIKRMVDRIEMHDKYMEIFLKCGTGITQEYVK